MHLYDRGEIAPGLLADLVLWDPETLTAKTVIKAGKRLTEKPQTWTPASIEAMFPEHFSKSVKLEALTLKDVIIHTDPAIKKVRAKVLRVYADSTRVTMREVELPVNDGILDTAGFLTGFCFNRHGALTPHDEYNLGAFALFEGEALKEVAVATTWFHDHHNLFVLGKDPQSRLKAANRVIELQGLSLIHISEPTRPY